MGLDALEMQQVVVLFYLLISVEHAAYKDLMILSSWQMKLSSHVDDRHVGHGHDQSSDQQTSFFRLKDRWEEPVPGIKFYLQ